MLQNLQTIFLYNNSPNLSNIPSNPENPNIKCQIPNCYILKKQQFQQLVRELEQKTKIVKAIKFRILRIMKNGITSFKNNITYSQQIRTIDRYFSEWKHLYFQKKIKNKYILMRVYKKLKINQQVKIKKNMNKIMIMAADNLYQKTLKYQVFVQWKQTIKIQQKQVQLTQYLKKYTLNQFKIIYQLNKSNQFTKQLIDNINKQKTIKKYFIQWVMQTKKIKIQKILFTKYSKILIKYLIKYNKNQKQHYQQYYHQTILKKYFNKILLNKNIQLSSRFYNKKLLKLSFNIWLKVGHQLFYQKQQQLKKQQKLSQHLQRKSKIALLYHFQKWKCQIQNQKQLKKKYLIAKQYGQIKQKQFLLKKYFISWKSLKLYNKSQMFYQNKIKNKIFYLFKLALIKTSEKLDNVYKFVENRQKRKYFYAIKLFIKNDLIKILKFRTQRIWNNFTFTITKNYVILNTKATQFHINNLKYKSLYSFKQMLMLKNKTNKTIIFINANMTLKRWQKHFKIKQFVQSRKFVLLGKIFRQLKLFRMNKIWLESNKKQTTKKNGNFCQKNNSLASFSISPQKLFFDSPEKHYNLEYSISAYNSNPSNDNI